MQCYITHFAVQFQVSNYYQGENPMKSSESLQSQMHQLLPQGGNDQKSKSEEIDTHVLKIIKNTFVFGNSVYQIHNICTVELAEFKKTDAINQSVPIWYWFLLGLGVITLFYVIGVFILIFVGWLFWQHSKLDKSQTRVQGYGLKVRMNSGESVTLLSTSKEFVLRIIVTLYTIMNNDEPKAVSFNFETLRVEDRSIKIDQAYGSSVVSGQVAGDVVNII